MIGTEKFTFTGAKGQQLDGRLEKPLYHRPRGAALFAHCFTCTKQSHAATRISAALAASGLAVLRFDFTGLGGSDGDFANAGFVSNVEDLAAAASALDAAGLTPTLLIGHSLGGAAAIAAAHHIPQVLGVATINAPFDTAHVFEHFGDCIEKIEDEGEGNITLAGRTFRITRDFLEQGRNQPQSQRLRKLDRPLLVLHAPLDEIVGVDNARDIFEAARHPKSFVALDGADHLLTRPGSAEYAAAMIAAWATPILKDVVDQAGGTPEGMVEVSTAGGKFAQWVRTSSHAFIADEPRSFGGRDDGPTPYDLLLASLGTCTAMTLQMYAERKKIALENVRVELAHSREHAKDCESCEEGGEPLQVITRAIELTGDLTDAQRARMLEIADMCPVHRTLSGRLEIRTSKTG
ncbi:bifunctional alpha/beta hydrolase/OsmC family protein [Alteraurantiacibacter aestuarii]|uniref:bifunctional alpha/beta hydrolase/OsmC family protein n=1 Tax=Alteraurantiacibacter aestuarii TaxID=650004 RepID=UPI0031DA2FC0